nr:hypothetical protein [Gammaproteobacteria bacterium]
MFSSKQKIDSSIAKYFITTNRLDLVEKFINLLIQVRKYPDHQGIRQSVNELTRYFQTTIIAPEYQEKYIAELKALQDSRHQDRWVAYQLH